MFRLLLLSLFTLSSGALLEAQCYRLVWADEFDGAALNDANWSYQTGDGCPSLCGWGNNEEQYYREENVEVSGGTLKLHVREENFGGRNYTSGRVRSVNKVAFTTGRMEASMKMPSGGQGYWPAFWLLPEDYHYGTWPLSGEIDIMEMAGHLKSRVSGTVHFGQLFPNNSWVGDEYFLPGATLDDGFHEYAIEWEVDEIRFYLDGVLYATRESSELDPDPWRFDRDFHFLLNCAVGGWFPGPPDGTSIFPDTMEVDYVRVYQDVNETMVSGRGAVLPATADEPYYVQPLDGASYVWTVPGDAAVSSGQGTPKATIDWGSDAGTVSVAITAPTCTATVERSIEVLQTDCRDLLMDFEDQILLHAIGTDGDYLFNEPNPASDAINSSSTVGRFARNAGSPFSVLRYVVDAISDADQLVNGELVFEMDVYAVSPPGTQISLNLENTARSDNPYPTGRHSVYEATTSVNGAWERLRFTRTLTPDLSLGSDEVNQVALLFQPGSASNDVFWFDNLAVVDAACAATAIAPVPVSAPAVFPNPVDQACTVHFGNGRFDGWVMDAFGRRLMTFTGNNGSANLDLKELPGGMYTVVLQSEGRTHATRLIKTPTR